MVVDIDVNPHIDGGVLEDLLVDSSVDVNNTINQAETIIMHDHLPHKSQKMIYKIKLLQIIKVIISNCRFMLSQLRLVDLAVILKVSDKYFIFLVVRINVIF